MISVTGVFANKSVANQAVSELLSEGITEKDISLIMSDKARKSVFNDDRATSEAGLAGALFGGAIGALIAGLTTIGLIATPAAGILVVGPIVSAFSGAGAGAMVGGIIGALASLGLSEEDARLYEEEIKQGKAVIVVHASDENKASIARFILRNSGAIYKAA